MHFGNNDIHDPKRKKKKKKKKDFIWRCTLKGNAIIVVPFCILNLLLHD
jgi:hypothetical protein